MRWKATIRVLLSSITVSISGALRLYVAFLLIGKHPDIYLSFAAFLIIYSVYTFDRGIQAHEDIINRPEERDANKKIIIFVIALSFIFALIILWLKDVFPLIAFIPVIIGGFYSKGIKIGKLSIKLKKGFGIKNFIVAFTWATTTTAFLYKFSENYLELFFVFLFFFFKSFTYSVICDCRDIKGDSLAGLITIPVYLGENKTRKVLQSMHIIFHFLIMFLFILGIIRPDFFIISYSLLVGLIYISLYTTQQKKPFRSIIMHGEWAHMLAFRILTTQFFLIFSRNI